MYASLWWIWFCADANNINLLYTIAGAPPSVVYYLAVHPEVQSRARAQVIGVIGTNNPPSIDAFKVGFFH